MPKIFILADDLTGAAEIGGIATLFGLSVRIIFNINKKINYPEEVVILDSNTRGLNSERAYQRVSRLLDPVKFDEYDLVFKKVDSILRGSIVAEIKALSLKLGINKICLIPANPSKNRIIRNGKYYIYEKPINKTEFRFDPEYPRLSEEVKDLITDNSGTVSINNDPFEIIENRITVPDITSKSEINSYVSKLPEKGILYAGGADFFTGILRYKLMLTRVKDYVQIQKADNNHFVIGSNSKISLRTRYILSEHKHTLYRLPEPAIKDNVRFKEWLLIIRESLNNQKLIVISGPDKRYKDPLEIKFISERLVYAAKIIADNLSTGQLFIEGGKTASMFFRVMGWDNLFIHQAVNDGIVSLSKPGTNIIVTIKPGSYKWPDNILK